MIIRRNRCWAFALGVLLAPGVSFAQSLETFGTRAAAMAAFVAVADDATAVAWNPSGLVTGPFFNFTLDLARSEDAPDEPPHAGGGAARVGSTILALGTTPLGLSYYRLSATEAASPAVLGTPDRQDRHVLVRAIVTDHLGATVQQSIGSFLTLGATLKLVRGRIGTARAAADTWSEALDRGERAETRGWTRGDVDAGAMLTAGALRVGLVVRNLTAPRFGESGDGFRLRRHARVGAAWGDDWPGTAATVVSFDADLTTVPHVTGERRDVAVGAERWLRLRRVGVRGGLRASTVGGARPVWSAGASYAVRSGAYVDAFVARGTRQDAAWGLAARLTY